MGNKFIKITNREEWQVLLDKVLFKTFFHNLKWEEFLEQNFKWLKFERYIYRDTALLSLARVGNKLVSHPFCEYGGPLPLAEKINGHKFIRDLFLEFKSPIKISFHPQVLTYFFDETGSDSVSLERVTYWLSSPPILRKTTRHEIEKAKTRNFQIQKCQARKDLSDFYNLYLKSVKRHKIPAYPFSFFEYFFNSPSSEIILARYHNKIIAGSIFLFYDKFIHYFQNASDKKYKNLNANYLILWNQIQKYNDKIFDFGGTRIGSSLEIFKRGWGGKKYPIFEISNIKKKKDLARAKIRKLVILLPNFIFKKISLYLLKYKL